LPSIWAYTIAHNERQILPYWVRHYATFCDRLVLYDDKSDDGTPDLARALGCDVYPLPVDGADDDDRAAFSSVMYREAMGQAAFVAVVDTDEFVYGKIDPTWVYPYARGYRMFSDTFPDGPGQIYEYVRYGAPDRTEDKPCLFRPEVGLTFKFGRHQADIIPFEKNARLALLHYRWLGPGHELARNKKNADRASETNRVKGYGYHCWPQFAGERARDNQRMFTRAFDVLRHYDHPESAI
jgi:hypothetical protein